MPILHQPYARPLDMLGPHQTVSVRSEFLNVPVEQLFNGAKLS